LTEDFDAEDEQLSPEQLRDIQLLLGIPPDEDALIARYIEYVTDDGLLPYKATIHYSESAGGKAGESLYSHILNGIFVLDDLRRLLKLPDDATQVLLTAFTIHDINKMVEEKAKYKQIATRENVVAKIVELKLDCFFPGYDAYLDDIIEIMKQHSGHLTESFGTLDLRRSYKLGARLKQLVFLMRAADGIDLSHSLAEQRHKTNFLFQLNSASDTQYGFFTHQVAEQRGSFTNIVHNAVIEELHERFGLTALLLYPEGAAYLCPRGRQPIIGDAVIVAIAERAAATLNEMTSQGFREFIRPINMGITVDRKCLDLNLPFTTIFDAICTIVQKRVIKADKLQRLADDSIKRTRKLVEKRRLASADHDQQQVAEAIQTLLAAGPVPQTQEGMRNGELIRSYYIFLIEHVAHVVSAPWERIYDLLDVPSARRTIYDGFDARMDRAYALAVELPLSEREIITRIKRDGTSLLADQQSTDPGLPILIEYLRHVLTFSDQRRTAADFAAALPSYVRQQHKQCVQCSLPLPTQKWSSGNVRSDIKVQLFSNRLGGGPGEPVKRVCAICEMQFLAEKLNYREIRNEQTVYLHLFPYSFHTAPFLNGMRTTIKRINRGDALAGALRLNDVDRQMRAAAAKTAVNLKANTRTKEGKAQPYGMYLPRYSETLGGVMTFPINPPSDENDTQKFLFVMQHALLLQRHFGCKVLVSISATPSLDKEAFGDLYFDLTPLSARGLIRQNDYHEYQPNTRNPGTLQRLWTQIGWLLNVRVQVATRKNDALADLVMAMAEHPLQLFYEAEKLAEGKVRDDKAGDAGWLLRGVANDVRELAMSIGGSEMSELDQQLQRLAEIAWKGGLRGQSLEKNSIMAPIDEVLRKLNVQSMELTPAVLQSAAAMDLYEHVKRIRESSGKPFSPPRLQAASEEFVRVFFEDVFADIYHSKVARLLSHEKILRSAFHLYIRRQIPRKAAPSAGDAASQPVADNDTELSNDTLFDEAT
jgi:CRISPR-associated protein Csc3